MMELIVMVVVITIIYDHPKVYDVIYTLELLSFTIIRKFLFLANIYMCARNTIIYDHPKVYNTICVLGNKVINCFVKQS